MDSNYLNNLLPRLKKYAQHVEIKEALIDKVWVIYGDIDLIEYEFERSGEISVTKNGHSYDGSWKILGSGRLKIKTDFTNNTLEYDFSIPGILVMKIAGRLNKPFLLYDPKLIPDQNIERYFVNEIERSGIDSIRLKNKVEEHETQKEEYWYSKYDKIHKLKFEIDEHIKFWLLIFLIVLIWFLLVKFGWYAV